MLDQHAFGRADGEGGTVRLSLWNHPTDTIYGMIARSDSIVGSMEKILGGEVYHYHSKMIMKDPLIGGAWTWHQDYGYWYQNGCLNPWMGSAFIAVDRCTRENGCLVDAGADIERVQEVLKRQELVHVEMEPGDVLFFHCNTLHRSDQNKSQHPRWSMICSYNAARNDPYKESQHPRYTPLIKVPDSRIREYGERRFSGEENSDVWLAEERDTTARNLRR